MYSLNVSSGIDGFTYYVSANYKSEDGVIHDAGGDAGAGFRGNFRFTPLENVSVSYNTSYNQAITDWLPEGNNGRSEEHTSELQSRGHLVCRLLLEKKKQD